jgi:hypothetical protein
MARSHACPSRQGVDQRQRHRPRVLRIHEESAGSCFPSRRRPAAASTGTSTGTAPGNQQGSGSSDDSGGGDIIAVYEFCAAEYGWTPEHIETQVTESQLVAYIDRSVERRNKLGELQVDRMVVAVNQGTATYYDRDALRRWQSRHRRVQSRSEFTQNLNTLASLFPGKVTIH